MFGLFKKRKKIGVSEGGSTLYKYSDTDKEIGVNDLSTGESNIDAITEHIEKYIGKVDFVYHEIISPLVHIDIHLVNPTPERNFYTLITSGMSDKNFSLDQRAYPPHRFVKLVDSFLLKIFEADSQIFCLSLKSLEFLRNRKVS